MIINSGQNILYLQRMFHMPPKNAKVHKIFVPGKSSAFLKILKETEIHSIATIFCSIKCLHSVIAEAGIKTMPLFYNCKTFESKDSLRQHILVGGLLQQYHLLHVNVCLDSFIKYTSYRVYLQINI